MSTDAYDLLYKSDGASAKFERPGAVVSGTVIEEPVSRQATDFKTKELKWWDKEKTQPVMEVVITIQTDERDPNVTDDDGRRRLFCGNRLLKAVREAIKDSGHKGSIVGGRLGVEYTGDGVPSERGLNPPKLYKAKFVPPAAKALGLDDI